MADIVGRFMKLFLRGHSEPFAVILRSAATKDLFFPLRASSAKNLLVIQNSDLLAIGLG